MNSTRPLSVYPKISVYKAICRTVSNIHARLLIRIEENLILNGI